jgi:starch synthase
MPSAFEPCGLSQMMSMRYGTLPVVSEVGGLRDTVEPYNPVTGSGTGFSFGNFSGYWMVQTLEKALDVYEKNADAWKQLQHNAMTRDFSWDTASLAYVDLYKQLV